MLGADYDTAFAERHWWTAEDMARFEAAAEPLVQQFSAYHPFPDVAVNGRLSRTENVADLAGLRAAFEAYRLTQGVGARDTAFVRQQDRQFFIAWARSWRVRIREDALRTQAATGDHAGELPRRYGAESRCMHGTTRSTCGRDSTCTSSPRRGCACGNARLTRCGSPFASYPTSRRR